MSDETCDPDCSWTGLDDSPLSELKAWRCDCCGAIGTKDDLAYPSGHLPVPSVSDEGEPE